MSDSQIANIFVYVCFLGMLMSPDMGQNSQICHFLRSIPIKFIALKHFIWVPSYSQTKGKKPFSNRRKCHFRDPIFKIFPGEHARGLP